MECNFMVFLPSAAIGADGMVAAQCFPQAPETGDFSGYRVVCLTVSGYIFVNLKK